jgi:hypothetical protein
MLSNYSNVAVVDELIDPRTGVVQSPISIQGIHQSLAGVRTRQMKSIEKE